MKYMYILQKYAEAFTAHKHTQRMCVDYIYIYIYESLYVFICIYMYLYVYAACLL